jgi:hypothetical protein
MSAGVWMAVAERLEWMSDFDALSRVCPGVVRCERLQQQKHGLEDTTDEGARNRSMYTDGKRTGLSQSWAVPLGVPTGSCLYVDRGEMGWSSLFLRNGTPSIMFKWVHIYNEYSWDTQSVVNGQSSIYQVRLVNVGATCSYDSDGNPYDVRDQV